MPKEPMPPMPRASQISDPAAVAAFFRDLLRGTAGLGESQVRVLAEACARRIKRVVVWDEAVAQDAVQPSSAAAFDPYAFSAVVVLTRSGKDGLMKRLATIDRPEHLRSLADAQHLAVDKSLSTPAELRAAIIKATEKRIANRRAAAS